MTDTILFVDDEPGILNSLKRELHDWARESQIRILTAPSAREGLKLVEAEADRFMVIVSDLKMPEMKGSDFLLEVDRRWPKIVTVLLTGFSETQELMKAVKAGIFSYILKPWEPDYLRSELVKAVESYRMHRQNEAYANTMLDELRWAGEMQRAVLKPNLQTSDGVEFRSSYRPVPGLFCGGDYYDVISMGADRYLLLLGDVAGHGVRAAFVTLMLKAIIYPEYVRLATAKSFSPAAFLSWLNERLKFELRQTSDLIVTFMAGLLDRQAMIFTYANAGHNHPVLITDAGPRELPVSGPGLGFAGSVTYIDKKETLSAGDVLLLYTDGLVEAGAKGNDGPAVSVRDILSVTPYGAEYHKRILETALERSGAPDFEDDVTLLTARLE
ncbi:MAG: SpoIIE family protein phosphatase [Treponema sp.]|nr:SpoIIE family protein phosphatase [Treponema sp.]